MKDTSMQPATGGAGTPTVDYQTLLATLQRQNFPSAYRAMCQRFAPGTDHKYVVHRDEITHTLQRIGLSATYDAMNRSYRLQPEHIGGLAWAGILSRQRASIAIGISGQSSRQRLAWNFGTLAREAQSADAAATSSTPLLMAFKPHDDAALLAFVEEFSSLVERAKTALRALS